MKDENLLLNPPPVVRVMPTAIGLVLSGVTQVIVVLLTTLTLVADFKPNKILLAPVKFVPVIVTLVPPALGPNVGEILVITAGVT